jgi:hypothetical protein
MTSMDKLSSKLAKNRTFITRRGAMEEHENLYEKIWEILGGDPGKLKILEHEIDMDLQMEYYDCSMKAREDRSEDWALEHMQCLAEPAFNVDLKKEILARMASVPKVECYRAIETFLEDAVEPLHSWAIMALNESRMLLESKIMDENQVFISTGLGGKDDKLRYFAVLMARANFKLTQSQKMVIKNEFEFVLKKFDGVLEESGFSGYLATVLLLLPMNHSLKSVFKEAIDECNRYGNFLHDDFIVTNVRQLSFKEIADFLERRNSQA